MKRWRNFTHDNILAAEKIVGQAYILLHIAKEDLFHSSYWIISVQLLRHFPVHKCNLIHICTQNKRKIGEMWPLVISWNITFFLFFFTWKLHICLESIFLGIYIFMKSTFPFKPESSGKMVKTSKFVLQNKTKKITSNSKNNNKRSRMFWRETTALYINAYINQTIEIYIFLWSPIKFINQK